MKKIPTAVYILALLVVSLVVLRPLFGPGFFVSDDGEWMVIRLSAFFQSFRDGQFPVRFLGRLNNGYGYPVANFLYPGFLYIGSLIHGLGFSFVDSIKIILGGSVVGAGIGVFLWLRVFFSPFASFLGAVSFLSAPYLMFDLYRRGSVGEVFAMLPAAWALFAISSRKMWLLVPALGLLLIAHNTLAILFILYLCSLLLTTSQPRRLLSMVLAVGGASFFWLPAILEKHYVQFDAVTVSTYGEYFLRGGQLFLIGPVFIAACIIIFVGGKIPKAILLHLVVFALSVFLTLPMSEGVWSSAPIGQLVQFPYRFLAVSMTAGAFLVAVVASRKHPIARLGILGVCGIVLFMTLPKTGSVVPVVREAGYYETNEGTTTVADEYMPRWVKVTPSGNTLRKIALVKGLGEVSLARISTRQLKATVTTQTGATVQLSTIYYPGWGVLVDDKPIHVSYSNERGLIEFDVPEGSHKIIAEFRETPLRLLADGISLVSIVGYGVLVATGVYKKRKT